MDTTKLVSIIVALILVVGAGFLVYFRYKKSSAGREEATKFLDGLKDALYNELVDIIKTFNYDDYDSLVGIESEIIIKMTDAAKVFITKELEKSQDLLSIIALKALTPEFIDKFVDLIINKIDIVKSVDEITNIKLEERFKEFEDEDESLQKDYSDGSIYYIDEDEVVPLEIAKEQELKDSDDNGLAERGFVLPNKKELESLNPQTDSEESYDATDESMEIIADNTYVDSRGRLHDKATGKFIKS